jgi:hypothetical protein
MKKRWRVGMNLAANKPVYYKPPSADLTCPKCHKSVNGQSPTPSNLDAVPEPGDLSICCYCEAILQYTKTGVRFVSDLEYGGLVPRTQAELQQAIEYVRELKRKNLIPYPKN